MSETIAIISMLHEPADRHSASRRFRDKPVLSWTLRRLEKISRLQSAFILCWDDQSPAVAEVPRPAYYNIACKGRRQPVAHLDGVAAAGRWLDGWRGGLLQTCDFDIGFHGAWIHELVGNSDAMLIDPSAALIDPQFLDGLLDQSEARPDLDVLFSQAAPGLSGIIIRNSLLVQLAAANQHPGKLFHYLPERPSHDPIAGQACVEIPVELARTTRQFKLNSQRQIDCIESATSDLNSNLIEIDARDLFQRLNAAPLFIKAAPREVVLELTTRRSTFPAFGAAKHFPISRSDLSTDLAKILFREVSRIDDLRLTLGGVGDPLCHPAFFEIVESARAAGIGAIHIETDLHELDSAQVAGLAEAGIDIVSINLPATSADTYLKLMGVDGYATVMQNIKQLVLRRQGLSRGTPIIVPTFVKCRENFAEMETWYDQWLRALGTAVITGPSDCAGQIPDCSVADMAPPRRKACNRLDRRMMVLADGRIVSCEQDVFGRQVLGEIGRDPISSVWNSSFAVLRADHDAGKWQHHPLCASCKEWHRP